MGFLGAEAAKGSGLAMLLRVSYRKEQTLQ